MKNKIFLSVIFIVLSVAFFSCDTDENCRKDNYIVLKVDFKKATIDTLGIQRLSAFSVDSVIVSGLDNDSILYNNRKKISSVDLFLNKFAEQSYYEISFNDTIDTLVVWHRNTESYLSFECGCQTTHLVDAIAITGHFIDSISIINNEVNTLNATNIELYRHY
jgi:hypothetical protein